MQNLLDQHQGGIDLENSVSPDKNNNNNNENENPKSASSRTTATATTSSNKATAHFKNIRDVAANFVKSSFTSCDNPLVENLSSASILSPLIPNSKKQKMFRGEAILKPTLTLSNKNSNIAHEDASMKFSTPSIIFPNQVRWAKFYSAAATLPVYAEVQTQEENTKCAVDKMQAIIVRHERLFKHPVSTGCLLQSGCIVQINNKKQQQQKTPSSSSTTTTTKNWSLYWGGRWKEEFLFKQEIMTAIPPSLGSFRINHFPGTQQIGRKDYLAISLQKMKVKFPQDYNSNVFPSTFILPRDNALFLAEIKSNTNTITANNGQKSFYIAKPPASSRGRGVFLFEGSNANSLPEDVSKMLNNNSNNNTQINMKEIAPTTVTAKKGKKNKAKKQELDEEDETQESDSEDDEGEDDDLQSILVQRYIPNPLLINGYKVDLRVYACCTSFDPLKIFVFNDGLVRFATVPFSDPASKTSSTISTNNNFLCAHLTNVSINVKNQEGKYHQTDSAEQDGTQEGSKWTIQALKKFVLSGEFFRQQHQQQQQQRKNSKSSTTCAEKGDNDDETSFQHQQQKVWDSCWKSVCKTITKVLISIQDEISSKVASLIGKRNSCFELYGFDILLDDTLQNAHVLEVNILPSLICDSALDRHIKGHMIADMLTLVGIGRIADDNKNCENSSSSSSALEQMLHGNILSNATLAKMMKQNNSNSARNNSSADEEFQKKLSSIISNNNCDKTSSSQLAMKALLSVVSEDADRGIVSYAEEELERRGGWERVFPTLESIRELKHLFVPPQQVNNAQHDSGKSIASNNQKRGNKILWAWEIAKSKMKSENENDGNAANDNAESEVPKNTKLMAATRPISQSDILEWMRNGKKKPIAAPPPPQPLVPATNTIPKHNQKIETPIKKRNPTPVQKRSSSFVVKNVIPRVASLSAAGNKQASSTKQLVALDTLACQVFSFQPISKK